MAREPRTVTTHRELTLPPEIVALICAFKPEEGHIGQCFSLWGPWPEAHSLRTHGIQLANWSYYGCCGRSNYTHRPRLANGRPGTAMTPPCRRFEKGMYHPGKLEPNRHHRYVRWTCCGATFDKHDLDAPVGCTPLDLTLRVTTVTRAAPSTESDSEETV